MSVGTPIIASATSREEDLHVGSAEQDEGLFLFGWVAGLGGKGLAVHRMPSGSLSGGCGTLMSWYCVIETRRVVVRWTGRVVWDSRPELERGRRV